MTDFGAGAYSADDASVAGEVFLHVAAGTQGHPCPCYLHTFVHSTLQALGPSR